MIARHIIPHFDCPPNYNLTWQITFALTHRGQRWLIGKVTMLFLPLKIFYIVQVFHKFKSTKVFNIEKREKKKELFQQNRLGRIDFVRCSVELWFGTLFDCTFGEFVLVLTQHAVVVSFVIVVADNCFCCSCCCLYICLTIKLNEIFAHQPIHKHTYT